ncbi:2,3-bisphosphoglycerate-independent phosphoglycerate mutase ApgM2 [Nocardioides humi]|uniref:2,3-bisphosphoglycerate-independent phosphoglycerate mutase ApgM2 n=2 Tax=Nocardioides humi TaxID=449461 RepID=A0ABN2AJ71_9ACTN
MLGLSECEFPGRSLLEAFGNGISVEAGKGTVYLSLRTSRSKGELVWVDGRCAADDAGDAALLWAELAEFASGYDVEVIPLTTRPGEAILLHGDPAARVTDSDPFFEHLHPWLDVQPARAQSEALADKVRQYLLRARAVLQESLVNRDRRARRLPALDVVTSKWSGGCRTRPEFADVVGVRGGIVASTALYRGLASFLDMEFRTPPDNLSLAEDMAYKVRLAAELIDDGCSFVHLHTKATDEAGHTKSPTAKRDVLEQIDGGLAGLQDLAAAAVVIVTGDHATPSRDGLLHAGEATPLCLAGPTISADETQSFGERSMRSGALGIVSACEILPLMSSFANRPYLLGHIPGASTVVLPDNPAPMRIESV